MMYALSRVLSCLQAQLSENFTKCSLSPSMSNPEEVELQKDAVRRPLDPISSTCLLCASSGVLSELRCHEVRVLPMRESRALSG
jgi:hypothetical protein